MTQKLSYASGTSAQPLLGETIGHCFDRASARWGEREALVVVHQDVRWTYAELKARIDAFAAGLLALGLAPGDRIGIWAPNCAEWVITQFATAKAGLILVNINPAYRSGELEFALNKAGCKALILAEHFKSNNYLAMMAELAPELISGNAGRLALRRLPALRLVINIGAAERPGYVAFDDVAWRAHDNARRAIVDLAERLQFDDPINIQFTSGTTGSPKGATLTHHNILNNGHIAGEVLQVGPDDRICIPVPLYHCFGMVLGNLAAVTHGLAMVFASPAFDAKATLAAVARERCSVLYGVPSMFVAMLAEAASGAYDLGSLRTGIMAGAPCPVEVMRRVMSEMNMRDITIAYGMTETSPISTQTSLHDDVEHRVATVGRVLPHTEVKIVDDQGRVVPVGTPGELCARGYLVMPGYWEDDAKTREVIDRAGWMHTGDLATMDAGGYVAIVGRLKDMVIRGGENVYPREVEEFLYAHPAIKNVQVFGVPDEKYGEELCAWIELNPGASLCEDDVRRFCTGRIAHFKVPRHIRFVTEFPVTVTGKFQKFVMRERMTAELGIGQAAHPQQDTLA